MKKYECFFEDPSKKIYLEVRPYDPSQTVPLSIAAHQGENNLIEVCLTEQQVDDLIKELTECKNNFKQASKANTD